jgi:hypothetical protein
MIIKSKLPLIAAVAVVTVAPNRRTACPPAHVVAPVNGRRHRAVGLRHVAVPVSDSAGTLLICQRCFAPQKNRVLMSAQGRRIQPVDATLFPPDLAR